jgi:hypothetical protein
MKDIDVLNHLLTSTAITPIIADRIWAAWLPERAAYPAITCNYVSDTPSNTLSGDNLTGREVISINCWAKNKADAVAMVNAVKVKMNGFAVRQSTTELNEEEQGIYRYAIDYSVFG